MIIQPKNNNLNYLMDRTFRCFNILFVLLFARTIKKYADVWDGFKNKIKAINGGKENDYGKDYIKINLILMMTCYQTNC